MLAPYRITSTDPCTGDVVWEGNSNDPHAAVVAARRAFPAWASATLDERIVVLRRYQDAVRGRADDFAALIARETGKPLWETRTEVASVVAKVDISITAHAERTGTRAGENAGVRQVLRHKPHGVLAVLGPYNFPAHLPNGHVVPALLAGNAVVFKPSELTPAVGEFMASCWRDAGLPDGLLNVVQGAGDVGQALVQHPGIDGVLFTGSSSTGTMLARQFADMPHKILALEMGGNNPIIAWDIADDDLPAAAGLIVQSAYQTAGQRCTCARRLILQDGQAVEIIAHLVELIDRIIIGAPFDEPPPFMGPVIDNRAADRLVRAAAALVDRGATVIRPIEQRVPGKPFLTPGLIDATTAAARPDEEHFGPLLQIIRVQSFDEALAEANNTRFGLAASLIGGTREHFDRFWAEMRAGVVNWNRPTGGASSAMPFGGAGLSGNHRPSAYYAADYCAWPVASLEAERPAAALGPGLGIAAALARGRPRLQAASA